MSSPYFGGGSGGGSPYFGGKSSAPKKGGGGFAHWLASKAGLAAHDVKSIPGGLVDTAKGLATHPVRTVEQMGKATLQSVEHPLRDPFLTALTIAGTASGVGSIASRAAAVGDAVTEGADMGALLKAAVTQSAVRPRLLSLNDHQEPLHPSANPVVRVGEAVYDKVLQHGLDKKPEGRVAAHAQKRIGQAQDETMRYQARLREAPAAALDRAAKKLGRATKPGERRINQAALELTSVNTSPEDAAAYHLSQADKGVEALRNRTVAKLYQTVADRKLLTKNEHGDVIVSPEHPKLAEADKALAKVQGRGDEILARYGVRSPEALKSATDAPGRYRAGGTYEKVSTAKGRVDQVREYQGRSKTVTRELSHDEATARLAKLDKQYEGLVQRLVPETSPYGGKLSQREQLRRNFNNSKAKTRKLPTVKAEEFSTAEDKLLSVAEKHRGNATADRVLALVGERQQLRDALNRHAEAAFARETPPKLPSISEVVAGKPRRVHLREVQAQRAGGRIVGGESARPGRGHVSYASSEKRTPSSAAAASPGPVVGVAKPPITSHANTGFNIEHGKVPENVTTGASRHFRAITRFVNTTERRNAAIRTGSDVRRSQRDVLVKVPGEDHAKISHAISEALGKEKPTIDEIHGLNAALDAYREGLVPGLGDNFAADAQHPVGTTAEDAASERGLAAPEGYKWVDRNALGDLAKPSVGPRGRVARGADNINSAVTAATVYFKIGHVGTRYLTNAATNIIQGSAKPLEIAKSVHLWKQLDHEQRLRALAAAGQHGFDAMPHEGTSAASKVASKGANWWARHADAPFRFNSIAYEARKAGFDTPAKFQDMLDRLERPHDFNMNAAQQAKVDYVAKRANREGIAYDRLSNTERRFISRAVWFYPWIRGTAGFAFNTLTEHPFKANIAGQSGSEGRQAQQKELGDLPDYEQGLFKLAGGNRPLVADFSTFSPFSTPADLADAVARPAELSGFLNPVYGAGNQLINGQNQFGGKSQHPVSDALASLLATTPEAQVVNAYLHRNQDQSKRMFKTTPLSALLRTLGGPGTPRRINVTAAHSAASRQRSGN